MDNKMYNSYFKIYKSELEAAAKLCKLKRNRDGKYKKSKIIDHDDISGKPIRIQGEGFDIDSCAKDLVDSYMRHLAPIEKGFKKKTFEDVAKEWYDANIKDGTPCDKSKKTYHANLYNHIVPYFKDIRLENINQQTCQTFMNKFKGQGESHVQKIRMTLKWVIRFVMENEYIPYKPFILNFKLPETVPDEVKEPLTKDEVELFVLNAEKHHAGAMIITMLSCGLRPCEIRHITYDSIDFDKKTLRVLFSKTENGVNRLLPLPDFCLELIKNEKEELIKKGLTPKYVFHQIKDVTKPHTVSSFYPAWNNFLREIDIKNGAELYRNKIIKSTFTRELKPYYLRHTFCTMINDTNLGDFYIKKLMGHSLKGSVTAGIYTHTSEEKIIEHAQGYIKCLNDTFNKILNK